MTEATPAVDSGSRAASSPKAMATVSSATTMAPITAAGTLVLLLELNSGRVCCGYYCRST